MRKLVALLHDENGATAIEYALIASLISVTIIAGINTMTMWLNNDFSKIASSVGGAGR